MMLVILYIFPSHVHHLSSLPQKQLSMEYLSTTEQTWKTIRKTIHLFVLSLCQ